MKGQRPFTQFAFSIAAQLEKLNNRLFMGIYFMKKLLGGLMILALSLPAQNIHASDSGLAFLRVGVGGRAVGMGEAYAAVANGAHAAYWNPAGLANGVREVTFSHNEWIQNIRGEFVGVSFQTGKIGWGFHFLSSHIDGIELREGPSEDPLGTFGAESVATGLSMGLPVNDRLDVGMTVKYLYEKIYIENASGMAVDLGARYRFGMSGFTGAVVLRHWGTMNALGEESTNIPTSLRWGLAYAVDQWLGDNGGLTIALDYENTSGADGHLLMGAEAQMARVLAARIGYQAGYDDRNISGGIGLRFSPVTFDYGITPYSSDLGATHRVSIGFRW
jgi:hypothetical protein